MRSGVSTLNIQYKTMSYIKKIQTSNKKETSPMKLTTILITLLIKFQVQNSSNMFLDRKTEYSLEQHIYFLHIVSDINLSIFHSILKKIQDCIQFCTYNLKTIQQHSTLFTIM